MLPASAEVTFGSPHCERECHIDPYIAELHTKIRCTLTQGTDADGKPKPTGVIHLGPGQPDPVVIVKVGLRGPLLHHLCGDLCARVHVECIGTGPEKDFTVGPLPIAGDDGKKCCDHDDGDGWCYYKFEVTVPTSIFEEYGDDCGEVCCFATTVTSRDRCGNPGHIACWCNGPCVMIHTAPSS